MDAITLDGNTPLHVAAASGLKGQTALLVAAGADTTVQNSDDEIPFDLANVAEVSFSGSGSLRPIALSSRVLPLFCFFTECRKVEEILTLARSKKVSVLSANPKRRRLL